MTNYQKIQQMDKEELSLFLCNLMCAECCETRCPASDFCSTRHAGMKDWLESETRDYDRE